MTSLRHRSSPLKFFASSATPKVDSQRDSQKAWEKDYLNDLRSNRPARPAGARPPPRHVLDSNVHSSGIPSRGSSSLSCRPSLGTRQTSPSRLPNPGRCSSVESQEQETSNPSSETTRPLTQDNPIEEPEPHGEDIKDLVQVREAGRETKSASRAASASYRERSQRVVEREEARMLREALQTMDMRDEARLHSAAQDEASDLVWKHRNPEASRDNSNIPYTYPKPSWSNGHGRSQSDKSNVSSRRGETDEDCRGQAKHGAEEGQGQSTKGHDSWDSPQKKAYMNLTFALPQVRSYSRRRSSGSRPRTTSGSLFPNPEDKIYEEPEEIKQEPESQNPSRPRTLSSSRPSTLNSATKDQSSVQPYSRSKTEPIDSKGSLSRTEIHRNPPSQSRNPTYMHNVLPPTTPRPLDDSGSEPAKGETKNGIEVRSDDIRAATSMRLSDRSPKLPSPTVVSNAKGRPIVSFDKGWTPSKDDSKRSGSSSQGPLDHGYPNRLSATARSKPPLLSSTASAPIVPTINVPEPPSIQIDEAPPVPSINVSEVPSISVSTEDVSKPSINEGPKARPLPTPSKPKPSNRPLPHHSSTAPVHTSFPHWSPSQRRATAQCAACALPISGRIVSAASQRYHPECFTCFHCSEQLECVAFYPEPETRRDERVARIRARREGLEVPDEEGKTWEDDGDESLRFYCHLDFHEKFSPRCRSCKTPIEGEVVVACGGEWHQGHFFCAQCGDPFDQKTPFVEKDGYA
ncbi:MAG: hypothetical protein Q9183_004966, partial [Haloplaca sp. 2 TL-2023]